MERFERVLGQKRQFRLPHQQSFRQRSSPVPVQESYPYFIRLHLRCLYFLCFLWMLSSETRPHA